MQNVTEASEMLNDTEAVGRKWRCMFNTVQELTTTQTKLSGLKLRKVWGTVELTKTSYLQWQSYYCMPYENGTIRYIPSWNRDLPECPCRMEGYVQWSMSIHQQADNKCKEEELW